MKTIPAALAEHYGLEATTLCRCLLLERRDGLVQASTDLDRDIVVDGVTYVPGAEIMNLVSTVGLSVDNTELTVLPDDVTDPSLRDDLLSGRWDNAAFRIFEVNYRSVADGVNTLMRGTLGEVTALSGRFVVELRSIKQALQQPVGSTTSALCRARFADFPRPVLGNLCRLDPADWMVTGAITDVTSNRVFTDSSRTEPPDWFAEGLLLWLTGANTGIERKVKMFEDGTFTMVEPAYFDVEVGDEYQVIAGCRKRHERSLANPTGVSDCIDKFANIQNFQGEPFLQGIDALTAAPDRTGE